MNPCHVIQHQRHSMIDGKPDRHSTCHQYKCTSTTDRKKSINNMACFVLFCSKRCNVWWPTLACPAMSGAVVNTFEYFAPRLWSAGSGATDTSGMLNAWSAPVVSDKEAGSPIPIIPEKHQFCFLIDCYRFKAFSGTQDGFLLSIDSNHQNFIFIILIYVKISDHRRNVQIVILRWYWHWFWF